MSGRFIDRGMSFIRSMGGGGEDKDGAQGSGSSPRRGSGSGSGGSGAGPAKSSVDELSREELLRLCIKLKKRLAGMDGKHKEVVRSHRTVVRTLADLQHLVLDVSGISAAAVTDSKTGFVDVSALETAWRVKEGSKTDAVDANAKRLQISPDPPCRSYTAPPHCTRVAAATRAVVLCGRAQQWLDLLSRTPRVARSLYHFQLQQARADAAQQRTTFSRRIVELQDKIAVLSAARTADNDGSDAGSGGEAGSAGDGGASTAAGADGASSTDGGHGSGDVDPSGGGGGGGSGASRRLQRQLHDLRIDLQLQKKWAAERDIEWEEKVESLRQSCAQTERRLDSAKRSAAADSEALASTRAHLEECRDLHRKAVAENEKLRLALELSTASQEESEVSLRMDLGKYKGQATRSQALVEELTAKLKHAEARAARCEELSGQVESLQSELNSSTLLNAEKRLVMEELRAQIGAVKAKAERRAELAIAKAEDEAAAARAELEAMKARAGGGGGTGNTSGSTRNGGAPAGGLASSASEHAAARSRAADEQRAAELEALRGAKDQLEQQLTAATDLAQRQQAEVSAARAELEKVRGELHGRLDAQQAAADEALTKHLVALRTARTEANAKSVRARQLIQDKDKEIAELRAKVRDLTSRTDVGGPASSVVGAGVSSQRRGEQDNEQNGAGGGVTIAGLLRDKQVAATQLRAAIERANRLEREVQVLSRATTVEGPNLEYLKNVILRFMSFDAGSAERRSLVPVICTLLSFTKSEIAQVTRQRARFSLFGSAAAPKTLAPPPHAPGAGLAARTRASSAAHASAAGGGTPRAGNGGGGAS